MPICPQCSATIHAGADDQCPACGYSLKRADGVFGDGLVAFRRVEDAAGVLTHQERQELLRFLADLERNIPPAALCIYITDYGQTAGFRPHAHWILNHAQIHHPSFGRREKQMAIEDAELVVRFKGEKPAGSAPPEPQPGWFSRSASRVRSFLRDLLHPHLPPPVRQDWMLILVLDVQLEIACFSWGYQLDPYIDPNSINRCIVKAKLQFRERAMVAGLRRVMLGAVKEIAISSRKVNARLRRPTAPRTPHLLTAALGGSLLLGSPQAWAEPEAPAPAPTQALADDDVAEEVPEGDTTPQPADAPTAPAPEVQVRPGAAASYGHAARWHDADQKHLLAGEMPEAYNQLLPTADTKRAAAPFRPGKTKESNSSVQAQYSGEYRKPSSAGLSDPQKLLGTEATRDVEHVLREINAKGHYRIYVAILRASQEPPQELAVQTLATATAAPCEYAALLRFSLGDAEKLDIGYQLITLTDDQRRAWLTEVRRSANEAGGDGLDSLLAAIRALDAKLHPLAGTFTPITPTTTGKLPLVRLKFMDEEKKEEEPSARQKAEAFLNNPDNHPLLIGIGVGITAIAALIMLILMRRRSGKLLESVPDVRLSSPYGAGVSRYVRYLEGKESQKEKSLY